MAVTVGRAEVDVDFDGHGLAPQARALGEEAGAEAGAGFEKGWKNRLKSLGSKVAGDMRKNGKLSGDEFNKGFDDSTIKRLSGSLDKFGAALQRNRVQVENHGASMKRWQAITLAVSALIVGAGNDIAVLGSAVGAGTFVLASAVSSLAVAGGVLVTAFKGLSQDAADLPAAVRPAAAAFADLKKQFTGLKNTLTVAVFKNSEKAFRSLGDTVTGLTPALESVGESVGKVFDQFAAGLAPGTRGFKTLTAIIQQSGPIFEHIALVAGKFAQAIGTALASPRLGKSVNKLLDWLGDLGDAFDKFTSGKGFDKWLDHADATFGAVGRLADSLGKTLNNLVSDKAVKQTTDFLDSISGLLPILGGLITTVGTNLDPLGLIGQALGEIGKVIEPLLGPLGALGKAIHDVATIMIDEWGKALGDLSQSLAPVVQDIADFIGSLDEQTVRNIADALLAFAAAAVILKGAQGIAGLAGKLNGLATSLDGVSKKGALLKGSAGGISGAIAGIVAALSGGGPGGSAASGALVGAQVGGLPGFLIGALAGAIASMFTDWPKWQNGLQQISDFFTTWWQNVTTGGGFANGWDQIVQGFSNGWDQITAAFTNGYVQIVTWFTQVIGAFVNGGTQIITWWNGMWTTIWVTVTTWLASIIGSIVAWLASVISGFISWGAGVISWWNGLWAAVSLFIVQAWQNILAFIGGVIANLLAAIQGPLNGLLGWWNGLWGSVSDFFNGIWGGMIGAAQDGINTIIDVVNSVIDPINNVLDAIASLSGGLINLHVPNLPSLPKTATGGIFDTAQARIIAEAGPEMVVPLTRDLSRVDPAVRPVAAYAQGKVTNPGTTAGVAVTFQEGSIVTPYADAAIVAEQVVDKIATAVAV